MGVPEKYRPGRCGTFNVTLQDPNMIRMDSTSRVMRPCSSSKALSQVKAIAFADWTKDRSDLQVGQTVYTLGFRRVEDLMVSA